MTCDLHTHSVFSDGTYTPKELIKEAERLNIGAIALCDHNTVSGLSDFMKAAENSPVRAVGGVEFSAEYMGRELHILALFVTEDMYGEIENLIAIPKKLKEESNIHLAERLRAAGYDISYERLKAKTPEGSVNRAHFAAELTNLGYTSSINEAFEKILHKKNGFYEPPERLKAYDVIKFIKQIGAVPVLAHPFLNLACRELREFLPEAIEMGLAAMETIYSSYDEKTEKLADDVAKEFGILCSGGSDFHGANKPHISLGMMKVPYSFLEQLERLK